MSCFSIFITIKPKAINAIIIITTASIRLRFAFIPKNAFRFLMFKKISSLTEPSAQFGS